MKTSDCFFSASEKPRHADPQYCEPPCCCPLWRHIKGAILEAWLEENSVNYYSLGYRNIPVFLLVYISEIKLLQSRLQALMWVRERDIPSEWVAAVHQSCCQAQGVFVTSGCAGCTETLWYSRTPEHPARSPGTPTAPTSPPASTKIVMLLLGLTQIWFSCSTTRELH